MPLREGRSPAGDPAPGNKAAASTNSVEAANIGEYNRKKKTAPPSSEDDFESLHIRSTKPRDSYLLKREIASLNFAEERRGQLRFARYIWTTLRVVMQVTLYEGVWLTKLRPQSMDFVSNFLQVQGFFPAQVFFCLSAVVLLEQAPPAPTTLVKASDEQWAELVLQLLKSLLSYGWFLHDERAALVHPTSVHENLLTRC